MAVIYFRKLVSLEWYLYLEFQKFEYLPNGKQETDRNKIK